MAESSDPQISALSIARRRRERKPELAGTGHDPAEQNKTDPNGPAFFMERMRGIARIGFLLAGDGENQ
jgi:hypothetical protein